MDEEMRSRRNEESEEEGGGGYEGEASEGCQKHLPCHPAALPYLKWKVFVRGIDSTLQGRAVGGEEDEGPAPALDGDTTRNFYESVVGQTDADSCRERDLHRQMETVTDRWERTDTNRDKDTHVHRETDMGRRRKMDTGRLRDTDTDIRNHERMQGTETGRHQAVPSSCEIDANPLSQHPHLPPTPTLPLGPQGTHTALCLAQTNDSAALAAMLDQGLNINTKDHYGWSLLMVAACAGAANTVRMLLSRGARTGYRDVKGNTALYLATIRGHREVTEILVKANKRRPRRTEANKRRGERERESGSAETAEDDKEYFCETCEVMVKERERLRHVASIVHQFKTKTGPARTQYGIPPTNRGYQLLVGQGWDAEAGLGPEQQGQKFPVKTVLKRNRQGLGAGGNAKPRVTHFGPGDVDAVKRTPGAANTRVERPATTSRREMKRKKTQEQKEEIRLRRMLNEPDY